MRAIVLFLFIVSVVSCSTKENLDGTWVPVKEEMAGAALPASVFEKQTLEIKGDTYTHTAESVDKGEVSYKEGKMDIHGKEGVNQGKHFSAIYKLENDELTICYNLAGDPYPEKFETKGNPMFFMAVFKKK
jgi:uncharacterized protein (TIGR03067 family)